MKKAKSLIYISLFTAFIFIASLIKIYAFMVPYTLQTMAVMLTACFLGRKKALYAALIYIFMGLIGIPVFTKGGGFQYVLEPTFGYILSFIPAVLFMGTFKDKAKNNFVNLSALLFAGGIIMLAFGALYVYVLLSLTAGAGDLHKIISGCFAVFIPAELIKAFAAAFIYNRLHKYVQV